MRRRELIALVGGAAVGWPLAARAQQARPVIALLGSGAADASSSKGLMSMLDASMREVGLSQGQDCVFETRWADSDASRFSPLAAELLALHPSAVVVSTILSATAVQKLSRTVPIVGTGLNAPVATGLAASLARPGGNITGVATMAEDLQLKLFEMMRETLPGVRRVMVMTNPTNASLQHIQGVARLLKKSSAVLLPASFLSSNQRNSACSSTSRPRKHSALLFP
jgi:putative ABC transport system substrate-binding protein